MIRLIKNILNKEKNQTKITWNKYTRSLYIGEDHFPWTPKLTKADNLWYWHLTVQENLKGRGYSEYSSSKGYVEKENAIIKCQEELYKKTQELKKWYIKRGLF
jgi:hypothetical protein